MTQLESFLSEYGLVALLLLATVEGDVSLLVAGVLAHLGIFSAAAAMVVGAAGNLAGDAVWFTLGRAHRERIRGSRLYRAVGGRIERLASKLGPWQLLAARVVYGTRNASMLFWGQLHLPWVKFLLIDGLGCALAAVGFVAIGYAVGQGTSALTGEVKRVEHWLLGAVLVGGVIVYGISRLARRELEEAPERGPE
jgi:membrane protein DedA with SNARE-associated domain